MTVMWGLCDNGSKQHDPMTKPKKSRKPKKMERRVSDVFTVPKKLQHLDPEELTRVLLTTKPSKSKSD